jgi:signal transduction histidine kinase
VTTSSVDATRESGARPRAEPARISFGGRLALAELALTAVEVLLVSAPALALAAESLHASGEARHLLPILGALLIISWVRAADSLRPVLAARAAKLRGQALGAAEIEAAHRAIGRAPVEAALVRFAIWSAAAIYVAVMLVKRGLLAWPSAMGVACICILHASGAAAARGLIWQRALARPRRLVLPNFDPLRAFAASYRRRLYQTAWALLAVAHAVNAALVAVFTDLTSRQSGTLAALTVPALVIPALLWMRWLAARGRPIEHYLDAAVRQPASRGRGPGRDDPGAVTAFRAAQTLPYRLAVYQGLATAFAAVAVVLIGRRLGGFDAAMAARLLGVTGLMLLALALYEILLLRDVLRPLLGQLGSRHRLPVPEIRSPVTLRTKLVIFFGSVTIFTSGLVLLFALSPARGLTVMLGSVALALFLALGLVLLIVRDMVTPIRALEERSDEMARGELARPVPPSGEADEIGRLTFAFEEMRRALRDKLRSTESLNIDLEREVRRRTEVLEQRNGELREALEKLRRAQDDLIRTEKLASMGRLVAGIAHEINNPVNAVINTLGPLEEALRERGGDGGVQEMLEVLKRGAARSKAIVQALHNYSRGDEETPRELTLARSVDDALDLLRHRLKNVRVEKQIDPGIRIVGFAGQIDQVFMNLITNAAQAIGDRPRGGIIQISAARRGDEVEIAVADDGPGIAPEVVPRIFDPFFTTKDVGEGSGLGLSIVHGIIDRHGGKIRVESRVGEGTTFSIALPLRAPSPPPKQRS